MVVRDCRCLSLDSVHSRKLYLCTNQESTTDLSSHYCEIQQCKTSLGSCTSQWIYIWGLHSKSRAIVLLCHFDMHFFSHSSTVYLCFQITCNICHAHTQTTFCGSCEMAPAAQTRGPMIKYNDYGPRILYQLK